MKLEIIKINERLLPLPLSYDLDYEDIEYDTKGETEAGTIQRDVIRFGVVSISLTFHCSPKWVKIFSEFSKVAVLNVEYFDTRVMSLVKTEMYMEGLKIKLVKDTSYQGLWEVSFYLKEY